MRPLLLTRKGEVFRAQKWKITGHKSFMFTDLKIKIVKIIH